MTAVDGMTRLLTALALALAFLAAGAAALLVWLYRVGEQSAEGAED